MKQGKLLFLLLFILFLGGCSQKSLQAEDTSTQTDTLLRVSEWEETGIDLRGKLNLKMIRDTLFHIDEEWETHEDAKSVTGTSVYRKEKDRNSEVLADFAGTGLISYFIDEVKNLHVLYLKENGKEREYFLKKVTDQGTVLYDTPIVFKGTDLELQAFERIFTVHMGEVNNSGEICALNSYGDIYFFDASGNPGIVE